MFTVTAGARGGISQSVVNSVLSIANAAANYWDRYIDTSLASIDIEISFAALDEDTLAQAGTDYYFAFSSGGFDYFEPETVIEMLTGFDENGSNPDIPIEIDTATLTAGDFNLGALVDGVSDGGAGYDLWTVLVHEIAHGLGLLSFIDEGGTDRSTFDRYVFSSGGGNFSFDGPDPDFGPIPLDEGIAHIDSSVTSPLNPSIGSGFASYLSALDVSLIGDIGAPLKRPTAGDDNLASFGVRSNSGSPNPDFHALAGNDTVLGLPTADRLFGDDGNDLLYASDGGDTLDGGAGNDTLRGDGGADNLDGGSDLDVADYGGSSAVSVNLLTGIGSGGDAAGDSYTSIEGVIGSALSDTLTAGNGGATFIGGSGRDLIDGGDGSDTIDGGVGADRIIGGLGDDNLVGGHGRDLIRGDEGGDTLTGGIGKDTLAGAGGADSLSGGSKGDSLDSGSHNDTLRGLGGNDRIDGGAANDLVLAGAGHDVMFASAGDDTLVGGRGDDTMNFSPGGGAERWLDFAAGAATDDVVRILGFGAAFDAFAEVLAAATDNGIDATIDFGGGDMLVLRGVLVSQLDADDFTFG